MDERRLEFALRGPLLLGNVDFLVLVICCLVLGNEIVDVWLDDLDFWKTGWKPASLDDNEA